MSMNQDPALTIARKALELAGRCVTTSVASSNMLLSTVNDSSAIYINANGGTLETINIISEKGESTMGEERDASIQITSYKGGVGIASFANKSNSVFIKTLGGTLDTITIVSEKSESVLNMDTDASIQFTSMKGGIGAYASVNDSAAVSIIVDGGDDTGIFISNQAGNSGESVNMNSQLGGILIDAYTDTTINAKTGAVTITGGVNSDVGHSFAPTIYIHANGGTEETIKLHSSLGTQSNSILLLSEKGGVTLASKCPEVDTGLQNLGRPYGRWIPPIVSGASGSSNGLFTLKWEFYIDLNELHSGGDPGDIIGSNNASACNFGQYDSSYMGQVVGGTMLCLQTPAGGDSNIDVYCAAESTGAEGSSIAALTETRLLNHGEAWTAGQIDALDVSGVTSGKYLYFVGQDGNDALYTAGRFLLTFYCVRDIELYYG